jgi:hypothetical protein
MAGEFSDAQRPTLPGVYTRFVATAPQTTPPQAAVTVGIPITSDWGPMDDPRLYGSFQAFAADFGIGGVVSDTPGARAVLDAFRGEGLEGRGGAGGVLVARIGGAAAAKAQVVVNNPAPAPALTLRAKYEGARGNALSAVIGPVVSGQQEVTIFDGASELESYTFTIAGPGALAGLAATINSVSKVVEVAVPVTLEGTTGLAAGTLQLVGGNDGATLTTGDHTASWSLFANSDFGFFAPMDIPWAQGATEPAPTNRSLIQSLVAWVQSEVDRGHRFTAFVGGALDELPADGIARAQSLANENIITAAGPGVNDAVYGPRSTSQLAPRIAGIYAQRGEGMAAHYARLAGTTLRNKPAGGGGVTLQDAEDMTNAGAVAIMRDRFVDAPTRLVKSVNTYTADTVGKPRRIYGNPKYVLSMQQFANEAEAEVEQEVIGRVIVNQSTRDAAAARVLRLAKKREGAAFEPGTQVIALAGSDDDEFVEVQVTLAFGRALAQLFIRGNVR